MRLRFNSGCRSYLNHGFDPMIESVILTQITEYCMLTLSQRSSGFCGICRSCGICQRQCHYEFKYGTLKIMYRIECKTEVDPTNLISLRQVSVSIALKYKISNSV